MFTVYAVMTAIQRQKRGKKSYLVRCQNIMVCNVRRVIRECIITNIDKNKPSRYTDNDEVRNLGHTHKHEAGLNK